MIDSNFFESLSEKLSTLLPQELHCFREDFKKNTLGALQGVFAKLDLVTREEFDVQTKLLQKARERILILENKISNIPSSAK